jgi:preprotein translocase subunit SecG
MTSLIIGLLTLALVLNSVLLILMVLVQLPKKEAGLGMAFGGAAADALFGAGSGTVLSKWTKYGTGTFLALSLILSVLRNHEARASGRNIIRDLQQAGTAPAAAAPAVPGASTAVPVLQTTNLPAPVTTNAPAPAAAPSAPATNAAPGK